MTKIQAENEGLNQEIRRIKAKLYSYVKAHNSYSHPIVVEISKHLDEKIFQIQKNSHVIY